MSYVESIVKESRLCRSACPWEKVTITDLTKRIAVLRQQTLGVMGIICDTNDILAKECKQCERLESHVNIIQEALSSATRSRSASEFSEHYTSESVSSDQQGTVVAVSTSTTSSRVPRTMEPPPDIQVRTLPEVVTTLCVRNIPGWYELDDLLQEWPSEGSVDYLYLPPKTHRRKGTTPYAFINFLTHEQAADSIDIGMVTDSGITAPGST
jgi:hypothetical protein